MADQAPAAEVTPPAADPAPAAVEATDAATSATPAEAAKPAAKVGFLARLAGAGDSIAQLEAALESEKTAHASTRSELEKVTAELQAYKDLEAQLEADAAKAQEEAAAAKAAADKAAAEAAEAAANATAEIPQKVAAGVTDALAALGVPEESLPEAKEDPPGPGQAGEFAHLKGRERAAAAFTAQFGHA